MIYLDNAATTKPIPEAVEAFRQASETLWANPSSSHFMGLKAFKLLDECRKTVAASICAVSEEIIFVSGATEGNNLVLKGFADAYGRRKKHIVVTAFEHASVLETAKYMGNNGYSVTIVSPDATGHITPEAVSNACKEDTFLVSTVLVCSETGAISPLEDICKAVKAISKDILVHSDCVQGYGHLNIDVKRFGIDAITVSGHKIGGIKGAGFVYLKKGLRMTPLLHGGSQENARRAGTESLPAIAAFAAAVSQRRAVDPNLRPYAIERLTSIRGVRLIPSPDAPHIICVCMEGVPGEVAVRMLSDLQICVSTGSACKKGARSTALASMKLSGNVLDSIIRVSLSWENSENDINILSEALTNISKKFHIEKN